jgi:hypothetical protein
MVEEPPDKAWDIERNELMDDAAREALFSEIAGCDGASRHQQGDAAAPNAFDQRQHTGQFADAGAVQPDQWAIRTMDAAFATAFREALGIFLAAAYSPRKQD